MADPFTGPGLGDRLLSWLRWYAEAACLPLDASGEVADPAGRWITLAGGE